MNYEDFTVDTLDSILNIYSAHFGDTQLTATRKHNIVRDIHNDKVYGGYRIGAIVGKTHFFDAKLSFKTDTEGNIIPFFIPGIPHGTITYIKARNVGDVFKKDCLTYLGKEVKK